MGPTCLALSNAITSLAPPPPAFILVNEGWLNAAFLAVYAGCMLATCLLWGVILAWLIDIAAYAMACLRPYKDEDNGHLRSLRGA
jgi:hypothetical protein